MTTIAEIAPPKHVAIVRMTEKVSAEDFAFMVAAVNVQVRDHLCPAWGLPPVEVAAYTEDAHLPDSAAGVIFLADDDGNSDSLGYHTQVGNLAYGFVDVAQTLDGGGKVSAVLSHEVLEMVLDQNIDTWAPGPDGNLWAVEACLAGETPIILAHGTAVTIRELAERGFGLVDVVSVRDGAVVHSRGGAARKTRSDADTIIVRLLDGSSFRCTPEHRVMLSDGSYRRAGTLSPGERLSQVGPGPALPDAVNGADIHSESRRHDTGEFLAVANGRNIGVAQFGVPMGLAAQVAVAGHSAPGDRIVHVGAMRTDEQVRRVGADRVVAGVANEHAWRDLADMRFVGKAMDEMRLSPKSDLAIAGGVRGAGPVPAPVLPDDALHEGFCRRAWRRIVVAFKSAIRSAMALHSHPVKSAKSFGQITPGTSFNRARSHAKTVYSVEPSGKCDVYDLTVPGYANFAIGAGVFVHNCDPVEALAYVVGAEIAGELRNVEVSDFVLPGYFAAGTERGDFMGRARAFEILPGGYQIVKDKSGRIVYLDAKIQQKLARKVSRTSRRV